jgi:hypothetical protein
VSNVQAAETIWSELFPGNSNTLSCFQPAVLGAETALDLSADQRKRVVWRMDGGSGSDEQFLWLLARGYHVLAKGISNLRAETLARRVSRWDEYRQDVWLAEVKPPTDYGRPTRCFVKRQLKDGKFHHSYYLSTLSQPAKTCFLRLYDDRGAAEIEQFRGDKSGLGLEARRKHSFPGQQGYILLTDLAHNLISEFSQLALPGSPLADFGLKRIVRDLFAMPGRLYFDNDRLVRVELLSQKQFSKELVSCLLRFCSGG